MTSTDKIREFCTTRDFRHQRDILTEQSSEMIMCLSSLGCNYYSMFSKKPTVECYAWFYSLIDLEILLTEMAIYCGEENIEKYVYHYSKGVTHMQEASMQNKNDIFILANLNKAISKARRNDQVSNIKNSYEGFRLALYFAMKRFLNDARDAVYARGLMEYYNKLYSSRVDEIIERYRFKEVT